MNEKNEILLDVRGMSCPSCVSHTIDLHRTGLRWPHASATELVP